MAAEIFHKPVSIVLKVAVSVALILWLLRKIDVHHIAAHWQQTDWMFLVLTAPIVFLACTIIIVLRWYLLLKQQGLCIPFWSLVVVHTKGAFLGSLLPGGTTAGDIYRMYSLSKSTGTKSVPISSVLVERAIGVVSLLIFSLGALFYSVFQNHSEALMPVAKSVFIGAIALSSATALCATFYRKGYLSRYSTNRIAWKLQSFMATIPKYFSNKVVLGKVFVLSLLLQLTIASWIYAVSYAIHVPVPFSVLCVTIPLIHLFTLIPISVGGAGVREAAYVFFLNPFGISPSGAVAIALVGIGFQTGLRMLVGSFLFASCR